jgi:hypothetical protein
VSHSYAWLNLHGRLLLVGRMETGWTVSAAAAAAGVSRQTVGEWYRDATSRVVATASPTPARVRIGPGRECPGAVATGSSKPDAAQTRSALPARRLKIARSTITAASAMRRYCPMSGM